VTVLSWLADDVTSTGFRAVVEVDAGATARLVVSTSAGMSDALTGPTASITGGVVTLPSPTLVPDTRYHVGVEVDGSLQDHQAKVWTDPVVGVRADVLIRAASCAGQTTPTPGVLGTELAPARVSNSPYFVEFAQAGGEWVRRGVHMGDWTYYDLGSNNHGIIGGASPGNVRRMFSDFLRQPNQKVFWSASATVLQTDDHELRNDHDKTDPGLPALRQVFSERVPHSPLLVPGTLYREERIGRVLCIYLDVRSERSPNNQPDGPDKSMLGTAQFERLEQTLRAAGTDPLTDYVLLFSPSVWWQPDRLDGWDSFQNEQQRLIRVIHEAGLRDRLDIISGDVHALGIDSGGNSPGGIRCATFAAIDSAGGASLSHNDLGPTSPGRSRWGTIHITYLPGRMQVRLQGWVGRDAWLSDTRTIPLNDPEPPPPDPGDLPDDTPATASAVVEWFACDARTGDVIRYLPGLTGGIERALSSYSTTTLKLPAPLWGQLALGSGLYEVARIRRTMLVCVINNKPAWAGLITRIKDGVGVDVEFGVASLEAWLDDHYVHDHKWTGVDESVIVRGLLADAMDMGINLVIDAPPTGTPRERQYFDTDDATVYQRLQELAEVNGGPDWTIDVDWEVPERRVVAIFRLRTHIGKLEPTATLSTTGLTRATWTRTRDYGHGYGATHVMAYSSAGEGDDRPQSSPWIADDLEAAGWPRKELRFVPSSSITNQGVLESHAARRLAEIREGTTTYEVTVRRDYEPGRWGIDWNLGDMVNLDLRGHLDSPQVSGRVIGWRMDTEGGLITPTILT